VYKDKDRDKGINNKDREVIRISHRSEQLEINKDNREDLTLMDSNRDRVNLVPMQPREEVIRISHRSEQLQTNKASREDLMLMDSNRDRDLNNPGKDHRQVANPIVLTREQLLTNKVSKEDSMLMDNNRDRVNPVPIIKARQAANHIALTSEQLLTNKVSKEDSMLMDSNRDRDLNNLGKDHRLSHRSVQLETNKANRVVLRLEDRMLVSPKEPRMLKEEEAANLTA